MLAASTPRIARYLQNLLNEPVTAPVGFQPSAGLAGGSGQGIAAASLRRALAACGKAGPPPVLAAELEHSILSALLLGQPHNYTRAIYREQALPAPRVVRRVVELIDSAPETAFTVADLAVCAGVSERSLHAAVLIWVPPRPALPVPDRRDRAAGRSRTSQ